MPELDQQHLANRIVELRADDREFVEAAPSPAVAEAMRQADGDLVATMTAALTGYADRPALARRARQVVPPGRPEPRRNSCRATRR